MRKTETQKGKINDVLFMYNNIMHACTDAHTPTHLIIPGCITVSKVCHIEE